MKARDVRRGMVVVVPPEPPLHEGFNEVVRTALDSTDGANPTRVLQLANGYSWVTSPGSEVTVIPA